MRNAWALHRTLVPCLHPGKTRLPRHVRAVLLDCPEEGRAVDLQTVVLVELARGSLERLVDTEVAHRPLQAERTARRADPERRVDRSNTALGGRAREVGRRHRDRSEHRPERDHRAALNPVAPRLRALNGRAAESLGHTRRQALSDHAEHVLHHGVEQKRRLLQS